ncbi:hypothetical protein B0T20DRAFT_340171, partial [Sordaria brevicollis]
SSLHMGSMVSTVQALVLADKVPGLVTRIALPDTRPWRVGQPTRRHVPDEFCRFSWRFSAL